MGSLMRVLTIIFWVAFSLFVASLFLSDLAAGLFGDRGSRVVNAALLVAIVVCSGAITSCEWAQSNRRYRARRVDEQAAVLCPGVHHKLLPGWLFHRRGGVLSLVTNLV